MKGFNEQRYIQVYNILYFTSHSRLGHLNDARVVAATSSMHLLLSFFFVLERNCNLAALVFIEKRDSRKKYKLS